MTVLVSLFVLTAVVMLWVVWGRAWLKSKPWAAGFFAAIEPIEIALWKKSETLLWSRFVPAMTAFAGFLTWLGAIDVTPLYLLLPEKYHKWLSVIPFIAVALLGVINEILRWQTTKPVEIVAVPDDAPLPVQAAIEVAETAKKQAVAEIKAEKQAGVL